MLRVFSALALFSLLSVSSTAFAQGRIAGTVTDADTGDTLPGVNVFILGTQFGSATDIDGNYTIPSIRAGEYTIQVSLVGYETKQFTGIRVANGETTRLDIEIGEAVLSTENEVVIVGDAPLVDVEESASTFTISRDQMEAAPVREVTEVVASQAGVVSDPTGLYIRGGRADETAFLIDGVSAKDPLAGTGFGLDLGTNAFSEVEVTTGGVGADVGDVTSGVVAVSLQEGTDVFSGSITHKRDNFGFNQDWESTYMEDTYEVALSGPILRERLRFFVSAQAQVSDEFYRFTSDPSQVNNSIVEGDFWTPRTDNRWNGVAKLTFLPSPGMKLTGSYSRSLTVNQNQNMLRVTGNDATVAPGFQYAFSLQPDLANTYAHDSNLSTLRWTHVLGTQSYYEMQVARLFTRLRADANGQRWRPENVSTELDPESIVDFPAEYFPRDLDPNDVPPGTPVFVLPGPGLINNGGIATRWHDHFAEEWTVKGAFSRFTANRGYQITTGFEVKLNDYQWIDIIRPWIGAPIVLGDGTETATNRLGESSDVWRVKPRQTAFYAENQFRYRGLIANVGLRWEFWAPGGFVDDLVDDAIDFYDAEAAGEDVSERIRVPILEQVARDYLEETYSVFGARWKTRLLPKVRVSFPVRENQVLFFNYGRSTRLPHPTFLYAGLNPFYQDRSFFADLGNPNLNPEVDISYELGVRNQITSNDALTVTAFWRDKYDFITVQNAAIPDQTGRETTRALRINGDFARVRGLEASYTKRIGRRFTGQVNAAYSTATGLSSTNNDALQQFLQQGNIDNTEETPLAWDRPFDVKGSVTYRYDEARPLFGVPGLNRFRAYVASTFRSGQRYTPVEFIGYEVNPFTGTRCAPDQERTAECWRPIYERSADPADRFSEIGAPWWWFDLTVERRVAIAGQDLRITLEVTNLFNQNNGIVVNPVTGEAYPDIDPAEIAANPERYRTNRDFDVVNSLRDPRFEDPQSGGLPPFNPARYLPQRHITLGFAYQF
ncbi:MAG: TonB-dependent receptor [Bacteroidota bacterium]